MRILLRHSLVLGRGNPRIVALQLIPVEQYLSYKYAIARAKTCAIQTRVLHVVRRHIDGSFQVLKSAKGRLGEFQQLAHRCGHSWAHHDAGALRNLCIDLGLSPAGWRFIHWHGEAAYEAILQSHLANENHFESILTYVEWQARAKLQQPLPGLLAQSSIWVFGQAFDSLQRCNPRLASVAVKHWSRIPMDLHREEFARTQWKQVLEWMRDDQPELNPNQWRAGWGAVWRSFQKSGKPNQESAEWRSKLGAFKTKDFEILPLVSPIQVELEGEAMEHCVADYIDRCGLGDYLLFSIRQAGSQTRIATVGLVLDGERCVLDQVKGKANQDPSDRIRALAAEIARRYQSAS